MAITRLNNNSASAITSMSGLTSLPAAIDVGKIGQVVHTDSNANLAVAATSYYTIITLAITPSATSSKILIIHTAPSDIELSNTSNMAHICLSRDGTNITTSGHNSSYASYQGWTRSTGTSITYLDSPNTTSSVTYGVQGKCDNGALTFNYNRTSQQRTMGLTLIEVLA